MGHNESGHIRSSLWLGDDEIALATERVGQLGLMIVHEALVGHHDEPFASAQGSEDRAGACCSGRDVSSRLLACPCKRATHRHG